MLLHFTNTSGQEIFINALHVVSVEPSGREKKHAKVKTTDGIVRELSDSASEISDALNRGMLTTHNGRDAHMR